MNVNDLIGERFGKLTVISFDHSDERKVSHWLCECDCGSLTVVNRSNLISGHTKSCGYCNCRHYPSNLTGIRFGRLTVLRHDHTGRYGNTYWLCECDCGMQKIIYRGSLISGKTTSCGCYHNERVTSHGLSRSALYKAWQSMLQRCENETDGSYVDYGGRGIFVCDEWHDFQVFRDWALTSGYDPELTLDRRDNGDGYYPENCRWVDRYIQQNNRRMNHDVTYNGCTKTIAEWSRMLNINYSTLWRHVTNGDMRDFEAYFQEKTFDTRLSYP